MGSQLKTKAFILIRIFAATFFFLCPFYPLSHSEVSYTHPTQALSPDVIEKLNRRISLDLRGVNVIDVLKFLSTKADLNIVTPQNLEASVNLFLKDVSIGSALEIIMLSTNLAYTEKDGIIYVMTEEQYAALFGEPYRDQRQVRILQLKYADATKVGEILGGIKTNIGKVIIDKQTGTIVLIDTTEKIKLMEEAAAKIDIPTVQRVLPTQSEIFELSYNRVEDLEPLAKPLLTEGVGTLQIDKKTNRLLVTDFPNAIRKIRTLVHSFDRKTRQVYIETKMLQVRLNNEYQMGISWEQIFNQGNTTTEKFKVDATGTFPISTSTTKFGQIVFGDITKQNITATIKLLHTFGDTNTLASPQLTVENNEEATILVGTRQAYVTSTVSQATGSSTTSEAVTFVDVGVKLKVLPIINKDGFISMRITPEVSSVGSKLTTSLGNTIPIVDTTNASTKVLVKDGHTVLIGGLMKDEVVKTVLKWPLLGDIPFLGALFRTTDDNITKTELVIFLTPHIVEGNEAAPFSPTASGKPFQGPRKFSGGNP